jgi:hypothetical protein
MIRRQNITSKKGSSATINDVVDAMAKISGLQMHDVPRFVVDYMKLGRIPRSKPSEKCSISMCDRLARLEARVSATENEMVELALRVNQETPRRPFFSEVAARPPDDVPRSSSPRGAEGGSKQAPAPKPSVIPKKLSPHGTQQQIDWGAVSVPTQTSAPPPQADNAADSEKGSAKQDSDGMTLVVNKRKLRRAQQTIRGTGSKTLGLRGAPEPSRDIFVYRVLKQYGEGDIRDHLKNNGVEARSIQRTSHDDAKFRSFHVEISKSDLPKVMVPAFWNDGVCVAPWYRRRHTGNEPADNPHDDENGGK